MIDLGEETRLTCSTGNGQYATKDIELSLVGHGEVHSGYDLAESRYDGRVRSSVGPASDGVYWGVLPCLKAIEVVEIMRWLPEVEDLIAVLDWAEKGRDQVTCEEDIECSNGTKLEWGLLRAGLFGRRRVTLHVDTGGGRHTVVMSGNEVAPFSTWTARQ